MIAAASFKGRKTAVFGLADSGLAAVRALKAGGAEVLAWDERNTARSAAQDAGADWRFWGDWPWEALSALVLSPELPLNFPEPHDVVVRARECGIEVIGEIDLFAREIRGRAPIVAVTGSKGAPTAAALIGHVLKACGFDAQIGGPIGLPASALAPPGAKSVYVLELSSEEIDLAPNLHADVAVLTDLVPEPPARHRALAEDAEIKGRLLRQGAENGLCVVGVADDQAAAIFTALVAMGRKTVPVAVGKILGRGLFVLDGVLFDAQSTHTAKLADLRAAPQLLGAPNWQSGALAFAACRALVRNAAAIAEAIKDFPGREHRIETAAGEPAPRAALREVS